MGFSLHYILEYLAGWRALGSRVERGQVRGIFPLRGFSVLLEFIHFAFASFILSAARRIPGRVTIHGEDEGEYKYARFPTSAGATGFLHLWNRDWD